MDAVMYFFFHFLYLGNPSHLLAQLWLAYEYEHDLYYPDSVHSPWKLFNERIMESYRATGLMGGLIASASGALLSFSGAESEPARTLLFASFSASVLAVSSCSSLLSSSSSFAPIQLERMWTEYGMKFVILLCTPTSWLDISVYTLEAGLLALVWDTEANDFIGGRVVVTAFIGFAIIVHFWLRASVSGTWKDAVGSVVGHGNGINFRTISPSEASLKLRRKYREGGAREMNSLRSTQNVSTRETMRIMAGGRGGAGARLPDLDG